MRPERPSRSASPTSRASGVAYTDARFRDKVVIVSIGGSWCPNCHDEAAFLAPLYRERHARGLEIVLVGMPASAPAIDCDATAANDERRLAATAWG